MLFGRIFPQPKGDTLCRSIAQPHAIHLTPSQGPPVDSFVFQEHMHEGQTSASVPSTAPLAELGGPEYDYLLKNMRGQLRELGPNRSLEWPHPFSGDARSELL
jgi:hypothetical protein